jgi:hypothetical protein
MNLKEKELFELQEELKIQNKNLNDERDDHLSESIMNRAIIQDQVNVFLKLFNSKEKENYRIERKIIYLGIK